MCLTGPHLHPSCLRPHSPPTLSEGQGFSGSLFPQLPVSRPPSKQTNRLTEEKKGSDAFIQGQGLEFWKRGGFVCARCRPALRIPFDKIVCGRMLEVHSMILKNTRFKHVESAFQHLAHCFFTRDVKAGLSSPGHASTPTLPLWRGAQCSDTGRWCVRNQPDGICPSQPNVETRSPAVPGSPAKSTGQIKGRRIECNFRIKCDLIRVDNPHCVSSPALKYPLWGGTGGSASGPVQNSGGVGV